MGTLLAVADAVLLVNPAGLPIIVAKIAGYFTLGGMLVTAVSQARHHE